jgi:tRNA(Ile)-lysidine synthetase-like protein
MNVSIPEGKYVLAVSGGVDSMTLLHLLAEKAGVKLVAAHFDHGIRSDSHKDEELVRSAAKSYGVAYEAGAGNLSPSASEATAREVRYEFLNKVAKKHQAEAIITAHHQDDLIETAFINLIRGTGRKGLSAISANARVLRPLLNTPKAEVVSYARRHKLKWLEDATNQDTQYLRNHLRLNVLPSLTNAQRQILISNIDKVAKTNNKIDQEFATLSHSTDMKNIDRNAFSALPVELGNELVAYLLRQANVADFDSKTVNRLSMAIKTSKSNSTHPVKQNSSLKVDIKTARLVTP